MDEGMSILLMTYGVAVKNKDGGTDFFAVNATSPCKAREIVESEIEGNPDYPSIEERLAWTQDVTQLIHEQFRGVVKLGAF